MSMRSHLSQARGSGSTNHGVQHWISERFSAIILVPLALWFVYSALGLVGADYAVFQTWLSIPGNVVLMVLFLLAMFQHGQLGLSVVIEDYVNPEWLKNVSIATVKYTSFICCVACILAVLKVAFSA
jgi:succinate dehydrogenase / fumarate reductase membrane anchor subunit